MDKHVKTFYIHEKSLKMLCFEVVVSTALFKNGIAYYSGKSFSHLLISSLEDKDKKDQAVRNSIQIEQVKFCFCRFVVVNRVF